MKVTIEWDIGDPCVLPDTVEGVWELLGVTNDGRPILCDKMFRSNHMITHWSRMVKYQEEKIEVTSPPELRVADIVKPEDLKRGSKR